MRIVAASIISAMLAGCASSPTSIRPAYVSPVTYNSYTCDQIDTEIMAVDNHANDLYHRIGHRANGDAWKMGIGLLVAWPALLFIKGNGAEANEYAELKGEKDALIEARRNCSSRTLTGTGRGEIPGTVHYGQLTLVPATTRTGYCIIAPDNYVGTGAANMPSITSGMPRCSQLPAVR